jgi:predicted acylesterase/phospholipase RssA
MPLYCCFDLVVGTSAGAIVASGIGNRMNMAECEKTYRHLVLKAFSLRSKVRVQGSGFRVQGSGFRGKTFSCCAF